MFKNNLRFREAIGCTGTLRAVLGTLAALACCLPLCAQAVGGDEFVATTVVHAAAGSSPAELVQGSVSGTVLDQTDAVVPGATVILEGDSAIQRQKTEAGVDGSFAFSAVPAGAYRVTVETTGFVPWSSTARVQGGEHLALAAIELALKPETSSIEVRASRQQVAEAQVELEEKQRVLGVFPNFYASYAPDAEPLSAGQKFRLAWRFVNDPMSFAIAGVMAGSEQRANSFAGYGPGVAGYAKRYGAAYTDGLTSTLLGGAILPAGVHQDPRYFVKGTGSFGSRALYAIGSMVICKGDNRRWQMNYSVVLGNFASASLSNLYYPAGNRGAGLVVQNALTATALGAVGGLFQEFLLHRMTPHVPDYRSAGE